LTTRQAQGMLIGLALGDALGRPVEFMAFPAIKATYGPTGIQAPPDPALYTDDTQMTVALAEGLVEAGDQDLDSLMRAVGHHFVTWRHSPENDRAPGATCLRGIDRFEAGQPWSESGIAESKGCGSAMRVAPIGYLYQHDPARLRDVARASSLITHGHPAALAASVGAASLVRLALDGVSPESFLRLTYEVTAGMADDFEQALRRVGQVVNWGDEVAAMRHIGEGWVGEEAVALALYCVLRYPNDYAGAVRRAANSNGDSDSIACIAGGIMGARLGLDAIPAAWRKRCEHGSELLDLGARLATKREAMEADRAAAQ
jgi:ADP-ribosylglycohydrolase